MATMPSYYKSRPDEHKACYALPTTDKYIEKKSILKEVLLIKDINTLSKTKKMKLWLYVRSDGILTNVKIELLKLLAIVQEAVASNTYKKETLTIL